MAKHTSHEMVRVRPIQVRNPKKGRTRLGRQVTGRRSKVGRPAFGRSR